MSRPFRQFIAVLLAVWLPLFSGSALAASVTMQMPGSHCHDEEMSTMQDMDMSGMDPGEQGMPAAADDHQPSCNTCGVCHLACTGYLAVPGVEAVAAQVVARTVTPYLVSFHSVTSIPLVPPPLARA